MSGTDAQVLQQAAEWFAVLHADEVDAAERLRWQRWLEADPRHAQAWERVEAMSRQFDRMPEIGSGPAAVRAMDRVRQGRRRRALKAVAAVGVTGLSAWVVGRDEGRFPLLADHRTGVGERLEIALPGGSRLWLNSASAVRVEFDGSRRGVALLKGELLADAAPDPRPFVVTMAEGWVRAADARFGLHRGDDACRASVFRGSVALCPADAPEPAVRLQEGSQASFTRAGIGAVQPAEALCESWSRGVLVADDMRLGDFVAELARYQSGYLGCAPDVAQLRLVGSFPLSDIEQIYRALERALPVRVHRTLPWWWRVEAA